jgi:hypothetical protein
VLYKPVTFVTHDKINFSSSRQRLLSFSNHWQLYPSDMSKTRQLCEKRRTQLILNYVVHILS